MKKRTALMLSGGLIGFWSMIATQAVAGVHDLLVGLDQKVSYGANGPVTGAPGKDAVLVVDVSDPAKPRIRASLPLMNSLLGPPTNLQITPDGKLGLVANSVVTQQEGSAWKTAPDDKLFVIDLNADPPKLVDTVTVGKQPSGLAISHQGNLALIANRAGKSVSVVSIENGAVKSLGEVPLEQEAAAVVITPDAKRAFVCLNTANKIGVLSIEGQKVTYDKTMDIPSAFSPYNIDVTPDGKYVVASNIGAMKNNVDAEVVIEATGAHPHVIGIMSPGTAPEGFAIAPDGKTAAAAMAQGSGAKPGDWFKTRRGELAIMSIEPNGVLAASGFAPLGALPEGIAYSADGEYVYVGNYVDQDMQVFRLAGGKPTQVGPAVKLPGQPASVRGVAR